MTFWEERGVVEPASGQRLGSRDRLITVDQAGDASRRSNIRAAMPYSRARHFDRILSRRSVRSLYQPLVDLSSGEVIAFEALARGPAGSPLERPDLLFETARDLGLVQELDWVCRAAAMDGALTRGLRGALTLFVNVEPDVAATRIPDDLYLTIKAAERDLRVILEVTERALLARPAELLHALTYARNRWWGVALDDVGANPDSLALMPFVNPDVIKLDFRFVRSGLDEDDQRVLDAVRAQATTTGATVLAEGIETEEHLRNALEIGASIGQGWYFGRPEPLPDPLPVPLRAVPLLDVPAPHAVSSPFEIVEQVAAAVSAGEAQVRRMAAGLEQRALLSREPPVVLGAFPPPPGPWGDPHVRFGRLRDRAVFAGCVGVDLDPQILDGWHVSPLDRDETMADEWVLAALAPHHSEVMVAYDAGERDADGRRLLDVVTTTDRDTVTQVSGLLMRRLAAPQPVHAR